MSRTLSKTSRRDTNVAPHSERHFPGPFIANGPESPDRSRRLDLIRRYGDFTLAYATAVQPNLTYFYECGGYIAYVVKWHYVHVLGDPVVDSLQKGELLDKFLARHRRPGFYQISRETANLLQARGYYVNEMGVDTRIDLKHYTFDGKSKEFLRYAGNWLERRGYRIEELDAGEFSEDALRQLDARWKRTRRIKSEVRFLNRPLVLDAEPDVRRFFLLDSAGKILAFVFFDPLYQDGHVTGYATAFKRRDSELTNGYAEPGIMRRAIEVFQREGMTTVRLGLSPLAMIEDRDFRKNWFLHHSFRYGFHSWWVNRYFYNLQGHAAFKQRFCGEAEPTYFATPSLSNDLRIAGMLRFAGII